MNEDIKEEDIYHSSSIDGEEFEKEIKYLITNHCKEY